MVFPRPHSRSLRNGRHSEPGQIYLITAVTHDRQPLFQDFDRARVAALALAGSTAMEQADTLAYVVMPDHFHWLMQLRSVSLSRVVQGVKSKSGYEINRLSQCSGKVWQHGFHDHALRKEEDVKAVARYVVANPLRAGLVDSIGDYPFWSAAWL